MKNLALAIASILTTVLLLSQTALAMPDGGGAGASTGDNVADAVPKVSSGLVGDPNCGTCDAHADRSDRYDHTAYNPTGKSGTGTLDNGTTKGGPGNR
jgi:hypothetical protein